MESDIEKFVLEITAKQILIASLETKIEMLKNASELERAFSEKEHPDNRAKIDEIMVQINNIDNILIEDLKRIREKTNAEKQRARAIKDQINQINSGILSPRQPD